jgi:hypothetical protein
VKPCELLCHQCKIHASSNPRSRWSGPHLQIPAAVVQAKGGAILSVDRATDELINARLFDISTPCRARRGWRRMKGKARTREEKARMELARKNPRLGSSVRSIFEDGSYKGSTLSLPASEHGTRLSSHEAAAHPSPR